MNNISLEDLQLDLAGIWTFEQERFRKGTVELSFLQDVRLSLIPFYIVKKQEPFISKAALYSDPSLKSYYDNYDYRLLQDDPVATDYFKYRDAFYDMNVACVINREEVIQELYAWLFVMKLRHLKEGEDQLHYFLGFHFHETFGGDEKQYTDFLSSLQQYSDLLTPGAISSLEVAAANLESLPLKEVYHEEHFERPSWDQSKGLDNESFDSKGDTEDSLQKGEREENPEAILNEAVEEKVKAKTAALLTIPNEGGWTKEEIDHYFSFLYHDRGDAEGSYLRREEVDNMLKGGIVIPALPLGKKFKLHYTPRYSKKLVNYFIYQFIKHYNGAAKKKILMFFGNYIEDYASALEVASLENLSKNITGEPPRSLFSNLADYMPERFL